jgi:hypothetical protein
VKPGTKSPGHKRTSWGAADHAAGRPFAGQYHPRPNGRSFWRIVCPFGGETFEAYAWSLSGGGKVCPCGHMFGGSGLAYPSKIATEN